MRIKLGHTVPVCRLCPSSGLERRWEPDLIILTICGLPGVAVAPVLRLAEAVGSALRIAVLNTAIHYSRVYGSRSDCIRIRFRYS